LPVYFADPSALAKLYVVETGSSWLRSLDLSDLTVSILALPEIGSVLFRRERQGALSGPTHRRAWRAFRADFRGWAVIRLSRPVLDGAVALFRDRSLPVMLRTLDALHLATALRVRGRARLGGTTPLTFLTADDRLEAAARHFGFATDNPNRH